MGNHRLIEDELEKRDKEYFQPQKLAEPEVYKLDIDNIKSLEDVKLILKGLNLTITRYSGELDEEQKLLVKKGIFKKQD
jgi:hypothetical protein